MLFGTVRTRDDTKCEREKKCRRWERFGAKLSVRGRRRLLNLLYHSDVFSWRHAAYSRMYTDYMKICDMWSICFLTVTSVRLGNRSTLVFESTRDGDSLAITWITTDLIISHLNYLNLKNAHTNLLLNYLREAGSQMYLHDQTWLQM